MKKNLFIKIVMALLVVLLAFAVVACKKPVPEKKPPVVVPPVANAATLTQIFDFVEKFAPVAEQIDLVDDEVHFDITLSLAYDAMQYSVQLQGDIYGEPETEETEAAKEARLLNNQVAIIVKDLAATSNNVKLSAYLKEGVIYLDQKITATAGKTKFTQLDGLPISEMLSDIPGAIAGIGTDFSDMITGLRTSFASLTDMVNGILTQTKAVTYEATTTEYILGIDPAGLGELVASVLPLFGSEGFGDLQGLVNFALDFIFGVDSVEELEDADPSNFPIISITALRDGDAANGLRIYYKGDLDKATTAQEEVTIGLMANVDNDGVLTGTRAIAFPDFAQFNEGALKASLEIDLGLKDLFFQADIYATPDFRKTNMAPTAYVTAKTASGDELAELYAEYDGETLYFDLAALYEVLGETPTGNTLYYVDFDFDTIPSAPVTAAQNGASEGDEGGLPFDINPDFLTVMLGRLPTLIDIVKNTALNQELSLSVAQILELTDGLLVEKSIPVYDGSETIAELEALLAVHAENYEESATYTASQITTFARTLVKARLAKDVTLTEFINGTTAKPNDAAAQEEAYNDVFNLLDKLNVPPKYSKTSMIADLNELLAPFAEGYEEEPEYTAQELSDFAEAVIGTFTGAEDVSVADIINATKNSANDVSIFFGLMDAGLGLELDISTGASKVDKVLNIKLSLDIVPATQYTSVLAGLTALEKEGAVEVLTKNEEDKYVILEELLDLLEVYKLIGTPEVA